MRMDIAIFGAGVAGLTAAIALRASGHRCRVYERRAGPWDAGMGFIIMQDDIERLQGLGLASAEALNGRLLGRYFHRDARGRVLHEQAMPAGAYGIRRRDLIAALMQLLPAEVVVRNAMLENLEFDAAGHVQAARLGCGTGIRADLYVAADGIHSRARRALFPDWPAPQARVLEVVGFAQCDDATQPDRHNFNKYHADGGGIAFGIVPLGGTDLVWYLQFDTERFRPSLDTPDTKKRFVEEMTRGWADLVPDLLAGTDFSKLHVWRPLDVDLVPHFHRNNLVLVGDAAHPLLPFTSMGVSSAIADGISLANALDARGHLAGALAGYSHERHGKCMAYIDKGRALARKFLAPQTGENIGLPLAQ
jgi:salicylate hydroxylase